ncbi:MAG: queuosine precursor transporter [Tatlockia sp.]|jgi:hypothetical protein
MPYKIFPVVLVHILLICISNLLVQYPFTLFGFHTTWGALSYPFIFITTDLGTQWLGQKKARKIIFLALLPGLAGSYLISSYYAEGVLFSSNTLILRIVMASILAYLLGQLVDIAIFQRMRSQLTWWIAPGLATLFANILDTYFFFFTAFYHSPNAFLSSNWVEIATVDLVFKITISLLAVVPLYGMVLQLLMNRNKTMLPPQSKNQENLTQSY